jgi:D-3-phosphoglycerate dehydrogenase
VADAVEKGKGQFAGQEIEGKTLGVIGLGAIGVLIANAAKALGMNVIGYDPFISVDAAWGLSKSIKRAADLKQIYEAADYITLHLPLNNDTKGFINADSISKMKDGVRILNYSRAQLVAADDIKAALDSGKVAVYVTDFPDGDIAGYKNVIAIPHLGASTEESEENCAYMAAIQLKAYLEEGNIVNSVNYAEVNLPRGDGKRVGVFHKNIPNMLSQISGEFAKLSINIENMLNKSKKENGYTVIDVIGDIPENIVDSLLAIDGVVRVRVVY